MIVNNILIDIARNPNIYLKYKNLRSLRAFLLGYDYRMLEMGCSKKMLSYPGGSFDCFVKEKYIYNADKSLCNSNTTSFQDIDLVCSDDEEALFVILELYLQYTKCKNIKSKYYLKRPNLEHCKRSSFFFRIEKNPVIILNSATIDVLRSTLDGDDNALSAAGNDVSVDIRMDAFEKWLAMQLKMDVVHRWDAMLMHITGGDMSLAFKKCIEYMHCYCDSIGIKGNPARQP